jgi:rSAM/selenodomain-associated transferase 1
MSGWPVSEVFLQPDGDLGVRMAHALRNGVSRAPKTILIGTDCPPIDAAYVKQAFETLNTHDVVLGPAEDGGYGLIGVKNTVPDIFSGIDWGTDKVLAQTCRKLNAQRINYALLPLIWDVDRPEDLPRYYQWLEQQDR